MPEAPSGGAPSVIFIAGWGRSGSTVLNRVLGQNGVLGLGEVRWLWRRGIGERQDCSCGRPWDSCPVWQPAVSAIENQRGQEASEFAAELDRATTVAGRIASIPGGFNVSGNSQTYAATLRQLYEAAAEAAGMTVIVDSSKDPTQALLAQRTGLPVLVVQLVRDPRAVVWSHRRNKAPPAGTAANVTPTRPAAYVAARWLARNTFIDVRVNPDLRLRYEDIIAAPEAEVRRIFDALGAVPPGRGAEHVIAGNPSRFERGALVLKIDDEWRTAQPPAQRLLSTLITAPALRRYGYRWRGGDT